MTSGILKVSLRILLVAICLPALAVDLPALLADRAAIERVYYYHRLGDKPPFVIEMPSGFLLYVARARTADTLDVAMLSLPKRSYEQWLSEQAEIKASTHQSN